MTQSTFILLIALVGIVAGGLVFVLRPQDNIDLYSAKPTPVTTPVDDTVQLGDQSTLPDEVEPINHVVEATLKTSLGDIEIQLNGPGAPVTVGNFIYLAEQGFYNGTTFHRVISNFMIQGGDPISKDQTRRAEHGRGGPGYQFKDEINAQSYVTLQMPLSQVLDPARFEQLMEQLPPEAADWTLQNLFEAEGYRYTPNLQSLPMRQGVLAMANSGPNTNGSQFFIITAPSVPHLEGKHTPFGLVKSGMDVIEAISAVETDQNDNPIEPVVVEEVVVGHIPRNPLHIE